MQKAWHDIDSRGKPMLHISFDPLSVHIDKTLIFGPEKYL